MSLESAFTEVIADPDAYFERLDAAKAGEARLSKGELQVCAAAAGGDGMALLATFPAEGVPEEIADKWQAVREVLPLMNDIADYLFESEEAEEE